MNLIEEIGKDNRLILAPMAEVTDTPFRSIAKKFGAGLTFTQMVSADGIVKGNFESLKFVTFSQGEKPIAVQILGNNPSIIRDAIKEISKFLPSAIDLNAGCPVPKVTSNQMGSALMSEPGLLGEIIRAMSDAAGEIPVSIKLRLGETEHSANVIEIAKIAEDNGASFVTVHGRFKVDYYSEPPIWDWIRKVKESISIPVIGNGSVFFYIDALKLKVETGCDAVMVGRGALGNPFIFSKFHSYCNSKIEPDPTTIDLIHSTTIEHLNMIFREYGNILGLDRAKKNIIWYFKTLNGIEYLIDKILPLKNPEEIFGLIENHVAGIKNDDYPPNNLDIIEEKFKQKVLFWLV